MPEDDGLLMDADAARLRRLRHTLGRPYAAAGLASALVAGVVAAAPPPAPASAPPPAPALTGREAAQFAQTQRDGAPRHALRLDAAGLRWRSPGSDGRGPPRRVRLPAEAAAARQSALDSAAP